MPATVVLVGMGQPAAPAAARSLARAGFTVVGIRVPGRLAGRTRYCASSYDLAPTLDTEEFVAAVDQVCTTEEAELVYPLADEGLRALIMGRPDDARWSVVGPRPEVFTALCDKSNLGVTADRAGLDTAAQISITPGSDLSDMPPLPAYVKVVIGSGGGGAVGRPVRVTTERECTHVVRRMLDEGRSVVIQEEVLGERWRFHFARQGATVLHLGARTIAEYPPRTGQSSVSLFGAAPSAVVGAATALLESTRHDGVGSIQFIVRGGRVYAHDVNLRLPASVAGTMAAGLDMPRLGVEIARGDRIDPRPLNAKRVRLVQLNGELPALVDALRRRDGGRSSGRIMSEILFAPVLPRRKLEPLDIRDPLPTLAALAAARTAISRREQD